MMGNHLSDYHVSVTLAELTHGDLSLRARHSCVVAVENSRSCIATEAKDLGSGVLISTHALGELGMRAVPDVEVVIV